jgi:methylmalonyl-CoA mutase cobalamin-binding domain/chain
MTEIESKLQELCETVIIYDKERALELVSELISINIEPKKIINQGLLKGIEVVKEKFENLEYFLPELIFASEVINSSINLIIKSIPEDERRDLLCGKVVIGTTKGDIHDVGKSIFATLLTASGFTVYDIGIDKHIDAFIEKAEDVEADIIAVSCLMTTSLIQQKELIEDLKRLGLRSKYKIIVGGGAVNELWSEEIGADGYSVDAASGVEVAKSLLKEVAYVS